MPASDNLFACTSALASGQRLKQQTLHRIYRAFSPSHIFLVLIAMLSISAHVHAAAEFGAAAGPKIPVLTLEAQEVSGSATLDGSLQAVRQSVLSAQASGRITRLSAQVGDRVQAGQVLAVVDDRVTQADLRQAQAGVPQAQALLVNARAAYERTQALRDKGFVAIPCR